MSGYTERIEMSRSVHRNISFATVAGLEDILRFGTAIDVRGATVRELRNRVTVLAHPQERCLFVPHRMNDVIANLAETLWVLAGRDDITWLSTYLPRAAEYSDDGVTWRGAYGPRLRNWHGVDQIAETLQVLRDETASRRAVMSLFDPARDFVDGKDIPCNNWLHWLIRDSHLHLTAAVRSNDLIWGFSGINSFCWSVLQEMMAFWVGAEVGDATYLASSFHLYDHHAERGKKVVNAFRGVTCYDFGLAGPRFQTPFADLSKVLQIWFDLECEVRRDPSAPCVAHQYLDDPLLRASLQLVRVYHGAKSGWNGLRIAEALQSIPSSDLTAAAYEFFGRKHSQLRATVTEPRVAAFLDAYARSDRERVGQLDTAALLHLVKTVHANKNAAYGDAWKKRGELTSILANVARKVDRLAQYRQSGAALRDESLLDTAVDLFVYLIKYRLYLLEQEPSANGPMGTFSPPFSDSLACFDALADGYLESGSSPRPWGEIVEQIVGGFDDLHGLAMSAAPVAKREAKAAVLNGLAFALLRRLALDNPGSVLHILSIFKVQ